MKAAQVGLRTLASFNLRLTMLLLVFVGGASTWNTLSANDTIDGYRLFYSHAERLSAEDDDTAIIPTEAHGKTEAAVVAPVSIAEKTGSGTPPTLFEGVTAIGIQFMGLVSTTKSVLTLINDLPCRSLVLDMDVRSTASVALDCPQVTEVDVDLRFNPDTQRVLVFHGSVVVGRLSIGQGV